MSVPALLREFDCSPEKIMGKLAQFEGPYTEISFLGTDKLTAIR
jgi:hypothetical protein